MAGSVRPWHPAVGLRLVVAALLCAAASAQGQDQAAVLLDRYLKAGVVPSAVRFDPDYPSEREVLLAVAPKLPRSLDPRYDLNQYLPVREVRLDEPVAIRIYATVNVEKYGFYSYLVPLTHPHDGMVLGMVYHRYRNAKTDVLAFDVGTEWRPTLNQRSPIYLIRGAEARAFAEKQFGAMLEREALASCVPDPHLSVGTFSGSDWFWYVRFDEGFQVGERTVHGVLVYPFAKVKDASDVSLEYLCDDSSAVGAGHVLLKHRFYTFGDEDIDLYALDEAQREVGEVNMSPDKGTPLYMPRRPNLVPIVPETDRPAGTEP